MWLLAACAVVYNQAPKFESVGGVSAKKDLFSGDYAVEGALVVELGDDVEVDVRDPDGKEVVIWIPFAPPGLVVDSEGNTFRFEDAGELTARSFDFSIIAQDRSHDQKETLCHVSGWIAGSGDTGFIGSE